MEEPVYFDKVVFKATLGGWREDYRLLLDMVNREIVYQEYSHKVKRNMPCAVGPVSELYAGLIYTEYKEYPMKSIRSGKTGFKPQMIKENLYEQDIVLTCGIKLTEEEYNNLLPYVNVLDFEPYRNREMDFNDPGVIGYRDEVGLSFEGVSNSCYPKIELPMEYYYTEKYEWPSERLYYYLVRNFFSAKKWKKGKNKYNIPEICWYGASSVFG